MPLKQLHLPILEEMDDAADVLSNSRRLRQEVSAITYLCFLEVKAAIQHD